MVESLGMGSSSSNPPGANTDRLIFFQSRLTDAINNAFSSNPTVSKVQNDGTNNTKIILEYKRTSNPIGYFDDSFAKKIFTAINPYLPSSKSHRKVIILCPEEPFIVLEESDLTKAIERAFGLNLAAFQMQIKSKKTSTKDTGINIVLAYNCMNFSITFDDSFTKKIFTAINPDLLSSKSYRSIIIHYPV